MAKCRASSLHENTSVLRELFCVDTPCGAAGDEWKEHRSTEIDRDKHRDGRRPDTPYGWFGFPATQPVVIDH